MAVRRAVRRASRPTNNAVAAATTRVDGSPPVIGRAPVSEAPGSARKPADSTAGATVDGTGDPAAAPGAPGVEVTGGRGHIASGRSSRWQINPPATFDALASPVVNVMAPN